MLLAPNPALPLVTIGAFVRIGADQAPIERAGLAALTARLLDEGSDHYTSQELAALSEDHGNVVSTFCYRELCGSILQLQASHLETGIELCAEMLRWPRFPADRFEKERGQLLSHVRACSDDPQMIAGLQLNRAIYGETPLGSPVAGTEQTVQGLDPEDVRWFHRTNFSPRNTILVLVGELDREAACRNIERHFALWQNPDWHPHFPATPTRQTRPIRIHRTLPEREQFHILQGHLGVSRRHPDYHALQILDVIMGSGPGFTSRIPKRLRDEAGLAYAVQCDITGSCGHYPGRFSAYLSTSPENLQLAITSLHGELSQIQQGNISEEELRAAQDYLTGSFVFDFESNTDLARFLVTTELFELDRNYVHEYDRLIRGISLQELRRVARQHLDTINYTLVTVGPVDVELSQ